MNTQLWILLGTFALFVATSMPIAFSIGIATLLTIVSVGDLPATVIVTQRLVGGIDSFALLAIPFFVLAGILMGRGGMARRLIAFADALVGRIPGGLGHANVLTCMLFGSLSGSAAAAVSSVGGFMIPEMNRNGYAKEFNVAITTTAATTGLMIPPSNIMIVYALVAPGVSVTAMFMAGIVPGILMGLCLMVAGGILSIRRGYRRGRPTSLKRILLSFRGAVLSLLLVVLVLGGVLGGFFTPTEAAALSVVYAAILAFVVYREVKVREIPSILLQCGMTTSLVMLLIGMSSAMSWILAYEAIPQRVSQAMLAISDNRIVVMFLINCLLLLVGTVMDMTPAILIFTPIFFPVITHLGIDPIHFGMIMIANLCIGLCTPPVGTCLFLGCRLGDASVTKVARTAIPFFIAMIAGLLAITYVPEFSLTIPRLLGLH